MHSVLPNGNTLSESDFPCGDARGSVGVMSGIADFGRRLRELRVKKGWTVFDLSTKSNVHGATISRYETGVRRPTLEIALKLARPLGTTAEYLGLGVEVSGEAADEAVREFVSGPHASGFSEWALSQLARIEWAPHGREPTLGDLLDIARAIDRVERRDR